MNYEQNLELIIKLNYIDIKELSKLKCLNKYIKSIIKIDKLDLYKYYFDRDIKLLNLESKDTLLYYRYNTEYKSIFAIFDNGKMRCIKDMPKSNINFINISVINYVGSNKMKNLQDFSKKYHKSIRIKINKFFINPWC